MTKDEVSKFYRELGDLIRQHRERVGDGMTQEQLGRRVKLSRTSIVNIEKGRQHLAAHQIYQFAEALKVAPAALLPVAAHADSWVAEKLAEESDKKIDKTILQWARKLS